ncbi:Efg1 domain-containing protein [Aspergillus fijiensis CBS 313.89]|uniref:rRNA-processing protein EFG1 n=1 Tax=Aspergillus fijiensis CBS 313.89 TaxID=1448319 RepID=A0A8G1VWW6_9EURO|nr:uncharacterized protein BO72DRAFT_407756 [Aspergillus fijiensis CBS 313.89]RAK75632.1 hypothetical protein BO72DRAFT_407756 [Aspergillus fijiensis CBS 313.89]
MPREYQPHPRPNKRKHSGDNADDHLDEPSHHSGHHHHPHSRKKVLLKKNPDFTSVNDLKKRIRAAKRLLAKPDLPADVRVTQERALLGYERDLEEETKSRERSKLIKKYHFVRFLERKTATKEIARLTRKEKEITENTAGVDAAAREKKLASVARKLHVARVNLNYTIYYPLTEKYIALYADVKKKNKKAEDGQVVEEKGQEKEEEEDAAGAAERSSAMWKTVEQCMKDGTLDLLRDGKLNSNQDKRSKVADAGAADESKKNKKTAREHPDSHKSSARAKGEDRKHKKKSAAKQDDYEMPDAGNNDGGDESDGGFFEM